MMENESLRGSRSTSTILLAVLLVAALVWAVAASAVVVRRTRALNDLTHQMEGQQMAAAQRESDILRQLDATRKSRDAIFETMRQHQRAMQDQMRAKYTAQQAGKAKTAPKKTSR